MEFHNATVANNSNAAADGAFRTSCIFWVEGVLLPMVGSIGAIGNVLSILVLTRRDLDLKARFVNLIITLCVFDILFVTSVVFFYTLPILSEYYRDWLSAYLTPVLLPLVHIVLTGSVYSVVAVAAERYIIICNPFGWGVGLQDKGLKYIAAIVVFSLAFNINKFLEVSFVHQMSSTLIWNDTAKSHMMVNESRPVIFITELRDDPEYTKAVILVNFFIMVIVPLLCLSVCHVLTYRTIRENTIRHNTISSNQKRDNAMAMLFFIIIAFFLLCHTAKFIINFYEMWRIFTGRKKEQWPLWAFLLTRLNHLMLVVNSSVNFFIYCFRDAKFREALLSILGINADMLRAISVRRETEETEAVTML